MRLYYHHVGLKGATEDFKKTVFSSVPISIIQTAVNDESTHKAEMIEVLRANFPDGKFNCWGVPSGASNVINNLKEGDTVLLVESTGTDGRVPVLCKVIGFWKDELKVLSKALWGSEQFPYIFFFHTQRMVLTWDEFRDQLGYSPNFDPRGKFYSVADSKLESLGGPERYTNFLLTHYTEMSSGVDVLTSSDIKKEVGDVESKYVKEIEEEALSIKQRSLDKNPDLTEGTAKKKKEVRERPRSAAFRISIKKLYKFKCAICDTGLLSPNGQAAVESAHIYPKELDGSDDFRNGICLCRMHHWAFDVGWLSIADDYSLIVRDDLPISPDYEFIRKYAGQEIHRPMQSEFIPHQVFLRAHRKLKGFKE